jgi:hypothetical protein
MTQEFAGQREGEKVIFIFRRHIVVAKKGFLLLLMFVALGMIPLVIWRSNLGPMLLLFMGFLFVGMLCFAYSYALWYYSVFVVTNERIRMITQKGMFSKTSVDLRLPTIEDITVEEKGVISEVLNFGALDFRMSSGNTIRIDTVPDPARVQSEIWKAVGKLKAE